MADVPASPWLAPNLQALSAALGCDVTLGGDGPWLVTRAADGLVLQLRTATGTLVAAQSRRQPAAEAARLVDAALGGAAVPPLALVIGAGLGAVVDDLVRRDATLRVLVVEPDATGAAAFLGHRDWTALIADRRLLVLTGPEFQGAERAWRFVPAGGGAPIVVVHPVLAREYPDDVRRAAAVGTRVIGDARANAGAEAAMAGPYLLNTITNLGVVAHEADVAALAGAFAGVPAIVAAAGPSLDRVVADVRRRQDRALVIAVDTALRPLLAQGVAPHIAVAVDPSERNARHLRDLAGVEGTWLVAEPAVHPTAFPAFAGRTFVFRVGDNHPWPWLIERGVTRGLLAAWGSVLVSALDLAVRVGAEPIAIIGADLAYSGGQPYCRGTAFEEDWAREVAAGERLADVWSRVATRPGAQQQRDVHGVDVPTLPHLVAFRDRLRTQVASSGRRIVNATSGGILHGDGIEVGTLAAALADVASAGDLRARLAARHRRQGGDTPADPTPLQAALADPTTVSTLTSLVPMVTAGAVTAALDAARRSLTEPPTAIAPIIDNDRVDDTPVWLPEQTAALTALASPDDGTLALPDPATPPLDAVVEAGAALLARSPLATSDTDLAGWGTGLPQLPLSLLLPLVPAARRSADRFGAALTRWIAATRGAHVVDTFWTAPTEAHVSSMPGHKSDTDDQFRLAIVTTVARTAARRGVGGSLLARLAGRLASDWPRVPPRGADPVRVTLTLATPSGAGLPWLSDVPLGTYARALSGAMFARDGVPRTDAPLTVQGALVVTTERGSDAGALVTASGAERLPATQCAPCLFAVALDDGHALLTRQDLSGSYLVDHAGRVREAPRWPQPILGEGRWTDGRAFAWSSTPARLMIRDASGAITHDVALPFTPSSAEAEGERLRFTALDGLWRWTPGAGAHRLADTGPLIAARTVDTGLELAPLPFPVGQPRRERTTTRLLLSGDGLEVGPATALGPCWSTSTHDGWWAEAYVDANVIAIGDVFGLLGWVSCDFPRTVAWAGTTLLIVTAGGAVLRVPDVRATLRRGDQDQASANTRRSSSV